MTLDVATLKKLLRFNFNYTAGPEEEFYLEWMLAEKIEYVKHYCNITDIPECIYPVVYHLAMGEFLYQIFTMKGPDALGVETIQAISSIKEDDTTINFDAGADQNTLILNRLSGLKELKPDDRVILVRHRSLTPK